MKNFEFNNRVSRGLVGWFSIETKALDPIHNDYERSSNLVVSPLD
jgi:hypothetical protein